MIKAQEYNTLKEYQEANKKAHNLLKNKKGYNSPMYANKKGILTIKATYLLPLVSKFKKELVKAGFVFKEIDKKYIKQSEII